MKPLLPFVPSPDEDVEKIVSLAQVKKGQKSVDLGAGDGKIVIAMAKAGAQACGFEIQRKYARRAKANIAKEGVQAYVYESDFWQEDLSIYNIVTVYGMKMIMDQLSEKLSQELRPGTIVISKGFPLPRWIQKKDENHIYVYMKE